MAVSPCLAKRADVGPALRLFLCSRPTWSQLRVGVKGRFKSYGDKGKEGSVEPALETKAGR